MPSSLNLQTFWWEAQGSLIFCWEEARMRIWKRSYSLPEQEGTGHLPSINSGLSQSLSKSTVPFCPAPQATSERSTQQQVRRTPDSSLYTFPSPRERKRKGIKDHRKFHWLSNYGFPRIERDVLFLKVRVCAAHCMFWQSTCEASSAKTEKHVA